MHVCFHVVQVISFKLPPSAVSRSRVPEGFTLLLRARGCSISRFSTIRALLSLPAACHLSLLGEITHTV